MEPPSYTFCVISDLLVNVDTRGLTCTTGTLQLFRSYH